MIEVVASTGSTSADLLERLAAGDRVPEGFWLVADRQTQGRGRQGRAWIDGHGNFMGSTVVHLDPRDPAPAGLSFVAALTVYETLVPLLPNPSALQLKWPNDVLLAGAKFCGLLLEREGPAAVVGIGVNIAQAPALGDRTTCSLGESGMAASRDRFAALLADRFDLELGRWRQFGLDPFLERWRAAAHPPGTPLSVHEPSGQRITGTFGGLEPDGALRLRLEDGSTRVIHAGDVSLENG